MNITQLNETTQILYFESLLLEMEYTERLDEFVMFLPLVAVALRIGGTFAIKKLLTSAGTKVVAKEMIKKTGRVAASVAKPLIKHPIKTSLGGYSAANAKSVYDWVNNLDIPKDLMDGLIKLITAYALPVAAVTALLYGGKSLYDYIKTNKDTKVSLDATDNVDATDNMMAAS